MFRSLAPGNYRFNACLLANWISDQMNRRMKKQGRKCQFPFCSNVYALLNFIEKWVCVFLVLFYFIRLNSIDLFIIFKNSILSGVIASHHVSQSTILHIQIRNFHGVSFNEIFKLQDPLFLRLNRIPLYIYRPHFMSIHLLMDI